MRRFPWYAPVAAAALAVIMLGIFFLAHGQQEKHDGFYYVRVEPESSNVVTLRPFDDASPSRYRVPKVTVTIPGQRDDTEKPLQLESVKESNGNFGTGNQEAHFSLQSQLPSPPSSDETAIPKENHEHAGELSDTLALSETLEHWQPPTAWIRLWSWPVSQCSIDDDFLTEAPSPRSIPIPPGRHVLRFTKPNTARPYVFEHVFEAGLHYIAKVDLESGEYAIEEVL